MGEVWRATDEVLGREVAVKLLHPGVAEVTAVERFRLEARAAARISDPHVVAVYDFGTHDDSVFLVMELVRGHSVADDLAASGAMDPGRAADIVSQAAAGLAAAHREGVIHRDVKPGNLLLAEDGTVKVADFGIARSVGEAGMVLTMAGEIPGTSHYLAPERARGEPGGPASDVYSLGCVLYQLITGRPPFQGDAPAAIAYQHVDAEPISPRESNPELPSGYEAFLLRMLAKDPEDRPATEEIAAWMPTLTDAGEWSPRTGGFPLRRLALATGGAAAAVPIGVAAMLLLPLDGTTPPAADPTPAPTGSRTAPAPTVASENTPVPQLRRNLPTSSRPTVVDPTGGTSEDPAKDETATDEKITDEKTADEKTADEKAADEKAEDRGKDKSRDRKAKRPGSIGR
jgi:eukaryotic-like serine/threonine-protein kinase